MTAKVLYRKGNYHMQLRGGWCKVNRMLHCHLSGRPEYNCFSLLLYEGDKVGKSC